MKKVFGLMIMLIASSGAWAQIYKDTIGMYATVTADKRLDMLGKQMAQYNADLANKTKLGKGFRLMVMSTSDREAAMKLRSELYKYFPEHKQYLSYQLPNIKVKIGNFADKADAEKLRKLIMQMKLVSNNIYILPETVELKPEKREPGED